MTDLAALAGVPAPRLQTVPLSAGGGNMRGLQSRSRAIGRVLALLPWLLVVQATPGLAADFFLHTTTSDTLDPTSPTATTPELKDSPAHNRTTYQPIGTWFAAPTGQSVLLESLSDLHVWVGLKNSDDQGTYFDVRAEVQKNGTVISAGETKNIQGVTRNPDLAKEVLVSFGAIADAAFDPGDVLSVRLLAKVADSGGHSNAVGLRAYYDAMDE